MSSLSLPSPEASIVIDPISQSSASLAVREKGRMVTSLCSSPEHRNCSPLPAKVIKGPDTGFVFKISPPGDFSAARIYRHTSGSCKRRCWEPPPSKVATACAFSVSCLATRLICDSATFSHHTPSPSTARKASSPRTSMSLIIPSTAKVSSTTGFAGSDTSSIWNHPSMSGHSPALLPT